MFGKQNVCPASGKKDPINLDSKISGRINYRTLHSGGSCPTLPQPQPAPLECSYPEICRISKGSLKVWSFIAVTSPFPINTGRAAQLQLQTELTQPSLDREGLKTECTCPYTSVHCLGNTSCATFVPEVEKKCQVFNNWKTHLSSLKGLIKILETHHDHLFISRENAGKGTGEN